jgi:hypothetical protein
MEKTRSLEAKVKLLQVGLIALGLLNVFILLSAFGEGAKKKTFEEIDANVSIS